MCEREVTVVCKEPGSKVPVRVPVGAVAALVAVAWAASAVASAAAAIGITVLSVCAVASAGVVWSAVRNRVRYEPAPVRVTVRPAGRRALKGAPLAIGGRPVVTATVLSRTEERQAVR